ncbi:MAG: ABC transporter permease [Acidobacteria bacterium]|nr:ABC transporter permease [Acidobacteriota bacterium]MBI3657038.1 ABC transporter permease [Acidobacteriota bacterium]
MASLAWRNLFHDKVRFAVTLTGVVFAIVLIVVQLGLFIGFTTTTSNVIDHSNADLWVVSKGVQYFDAGVPVSERKLYQVMSTPGIIKAEKYIVRFSRWKRPDGAEENVIVIGFNPDTSMGGPWNLTVGHVKDLKAADTVFIDEFYREKLGVTHLGQVVEINGYRARIVGYTRGIRSFTTSPFIFTSFKNALNYGRLINEDQTIYIMAKAAAGADLAKLKRQLSARVTNVDIFTTAEFSRSTQFYWMLTTGAGIAVLIAALMGLIVGVVVVAQTIYATTMDHLREFGTLKAMGAPNGYIYRVIIKQAIMSAIIGYAVGMAISAVVIRISQKGGAAIRMPWPMAVAMFGLTLAMCIGASIVSIKKVTTIDPAMVFKG